MLQLGETPRHWPHGSTFHGRTPATKTRHRVKSSSKLVSVRPMPALGASSTLAFPLRSANPKGDSLEISLRDIPLLLAARSIPAIFKETRAARAIGRRGRSLRRNVLLAARNRAFRRERAHVRCESKDTIREFLATRLHACARDSLQTEGCMSLISGWRSWISFFTFRSLSIAQNRSEN